MSRSVVDLHPVYNVFLHLYRFTNTDLPYRGYYQVRVSASADGSNEVEVKVEGGNSITDGDDSLLPASVTSRTAISRTIEVIYTDEEFVLNDAFIFSFKTSSIAPSHVTFTVELWFMDRNQPPRNDKFAQCSSRKLLLTVSPTSCLSSARSLAWEYGTASVSLGVLASLVSLLPRRRKDPPDPPLSDLLLDCYRVMSSSLLGTMQSLRSLIHKSASFVSATIDENENACESGPSMEASLRESASPWKRLEHDAVTLSARLLQLFQQTVELCGSNEGVRKHEMSQFLSWRTRRLSECFFCVDRLSSSLPSSHRIPLSLIHPLVTSHPYIHSLPSHPLASPQLDFAPNNMPVIVCEVFSNDGSVPSTSDSIDAIEKCTTTTTSPLTPIQVEYSEHSLMELSNYAQQKELLKESISSIIGTEVRLMSESCRSQVWSKSEWKRKENDVHLIVLVHGLEGAGDDLWAYRGQLRTLLSPSTDVHFMCSTVNEGSTWGDVGGLGESLLAEVDTFIASMRVAATRISFIAHSLGGLIVRAAIAHANGGWLRGRLHTLLTLNTPHLGLVYSRKTSHVGITLVQWYKRSRCLTQLTLRDSNSFSDAFLVKLASSGTLGVFKNVLLVGSSGDNMVPCHSALITPCPATEKDRSTLALVYNQMMEEVHKDLSKTTVVRYSVVHRKGGEKLKGRPAHTSCVEDSLFIEKLLTASAVQYFR